MELDYTRLPPGLQKKTDQACALFRSSLSLLLACLLACLFNLPPRRKEEKKPAVLLHHHHLFLLFLSSLSLSSLASSSPSSRAHEVKSISISNLAVSSCSASDQPSPFSNPLAVPRAVCVGIGIYGSPVRLLGENTPLPLPLFHLSSLLSSFSSPFACWGIVGRLRIYGIEEVSLSLHLHPSPPASIEYSLQSPVVKSLQSLFLLPYMAYISKDLAADVGSLTSSLLNWLLG